MKISISLLIKLAYLVLKWMILYSMLITTLYYRAEGFCQSVRNSLTVEHETMGQTRQTRQTVSSCHWMGGCEIECFEKGSPYFTSMQSVYDEHPECHPTGVKLILPRDIQVKPGWFSANVTIIELEIDLDFVDEFKENSFASNVFSTVEKLTIKNLHPCELRRWTFVGFKTLKNLVIKNARFEDPYSIYIESGVLGFANETLKSFELFEREDQNRPILIERFIGETNPVVLLNMEYVNIQYNLSAINIYSFTAIPNVKELDLSDCHISSIDKLSFAHFRTIQLLNLERNMLMTLPGRIFENLILTMPGEEEILSSNLTIRLSGNPWYCDCDLVHLKELLGNYSNFDDDILCDTPDEIKNYSIREAEFCPVPITTTKSPSTESPTSEFTEKECSPSNGLGTKEKISIKSQIQQLHISVAYDDVSVFIENSSPNIALIWFSSDKISNDLTEYHQNSIIDCTSGLPKEIVVKNLDASTAYTFCLINMTHTTISPLDCISYYHHGFERKYDGVWLFESSKPFIIGIIVASLIASIIIGMVVGAIFLRYNKYDPFSGQKISFSFRMALHCSRNKTESIQEAINPNVDGKFDDRRKVSQQFAPNGKQKFIAGFGSQLILDNPPPLPPHPNRVELDENDDNYYATVGFSK